MSDGRLLAELEQLTPRSEAADVARVSRSHLASPARSHSAVAEICLPESALTELDLEEQRVMLAHELAHLARRDPLWLAFASVVERVLWIQPLNRVARRRIATSAEFLCDEWAVRRTGSGVALARCLAQVAEWIQTSPLGVPVAGMAEERSLLVSRVETLLAGRDRISRSRRHARDRVGRGGARHDRDRARRHGSRGRCVGAVRHARRVEAVADRRRLQAVTRLARRESDRARGEARPRSTSRVTRTPIPRWCSR